MKKILLILFAALLFLPTLTLAATFESGDEVYIHEKTNDDLYVGGGILSIRNDVDGDLMAAGGRLDIFGNITQDVLAGGGDVSISGEVGDDVRVAGGSVRINATIKGDLLAAGGDLTLSDQSFVGGDAYLAGGNLFVGGVFNGDVKLAGGSIYLNGDVKGNLALVNVDRITFGPMASVQGNLWYRSATEIEIPAGIVKGGIDYSLIPTSQINEKMPAILAGFSLYSLLATLFFGLFFIWLCRHYILHASVIAYESTLKSLGVGFLILILTPIAALVFLITAIGLPVAAVVMALWLIFLYMGKVLAAMLIGFKIVRVDEKSHFGRLFLAFMLGAVIYTLIGMVPVVGWIINLIFILIALGSMAVYELEVFAQLRKKKIV